jgi:hypothetical protein
MTPAEVVGFAVKGIVKRINATSLTDTKVADDLSPADLQKQLEIICKPA